MTTRTDSSLLASVPDKSGDWNFLKQDVLSAAKGLIGCRLAVRFARKVITARIVETEAYHQSEPGSHAYKGPKGRAATMFEAPGTAYVYLIYGMYHCLNVVVCGEGTGAAVLVRAAEYESETSRFSDTDNRKLAKKLSGPGKLCRELQIDRSHNGIDLLNVKNGRLWLKPRNGINKPVIESSERIGLTLGGELNWRFYEKDNASVSRLPPRNR